MAEHAFAKDVLAWFDRHGRKDLPWQQEPTPYRVWVSEIMLQQTQVRTVIPYFQRFMQHFPELAALARADLDEVLHLWSGLGYYSRARNLHRAAQMICARHDGQMPRQLEQVMALPGIGRSTAGAILSLASGQRLPILDANVKRVLARCFAVAGYPGRSEVNQQLWQHAERCLPRQRCGDYNQAMMDLGATLCRRSAPHCGRCPLQGSCQARQQDRLAEFPGRKPTRSVPERACRLLLMRDDQGRVLLERRPATGIWGGLWSIPECALEDDPLVQIRRRFALSVENPVERQPLSHRFSHFLLHMHPCETRIKGGALAVMETDCIWYNPAQAQRIGLPAPVARLLKQLQQE